MSVRLDGVFDIECASWDRMVCGALYRPIDGTTMVRTPDELCDLLLRRGGWWWTWNGGRYDTLRVAETLRARGATVTCRMSGSSISRLVCGNLQILDATALIPMGLEDAAELAGLVAPELGWQCQCGEDCGGYCRIRSRGMDLAELAELRGYCAEDARVAYEVIAAVLTRFAGVGMELRGTLGGTAWETARKWAALPVATCKRCTENPRPASCAGHWRSEVWRQVRRAYFGGRTTVIRPWAKIGTHHDLSSAYPAALASTALPVGAPVEAAGRRARIAYERGIAGVYQARVMVDEATFLPPLPVRNPDDSTSYPIGEIEGSWTLLELQAAELAGARILDLEECVAWPDGTQRILSGPIQRWYGLRLADGKAGAWGDLWRLVCNALPGKFAEQPERSSVAINPRQIRYCNPASKRSRRFGCTHDYCTERCGSYKQLDNAGAIFAVPYYRIGESAHVHWAAYTTSVTRIDLHRQCLAVGRDLVYTDTDSIWTTGRRPWPEGDELGEWAFKHRWADFSCLAPKVYRYVDVCGSECEDHGRVICRVAGAPDVSDVRWKPGQAIDSRRGVLTLREGAKVDNLFKARRRGGRLPDPLGEGGGWWGDRRLRADEGVTYPVRHGESKTQEGRASYTGPDR